MLVRIFVFAALVACAHALTEQGCTDQGGHIYNNHCYIWNPTVLGWHAARAACENNYGPEFDLASLTSAAENDFTSTTVRGQASPEGRPDYWIGGHDINGEGDWRWTDGSPWVYTNWNEGEPNNVGNGEDFLHSNWGGGPTHWNDAGSGYSTASVCEAPIDYTITAEQCTNLGGHIFNLRCYIWNSDALDWHVAHQACRDLAPGAELASIHSDAEDDFIYNTVRESNVAYWFGLHDRTGERSWENTDGSSVDYTRWPGGEPNDYSGEDCAQGAFHAYPYHWNDFGCEQSLRSVCAIGVDEESLITDNLTFEAPCKGCTGVTLNADNPDGTSVTLQFDPDHADNAPCVTTQV